MEYVQTQNTRDKQKLKSKTKTRQRSRRRPGLKKEGIVPAWLADHTLLLQASRYPEARDLHRTKYGCCSNSIITC